MRRGPQQSGDTRHGARAERSEAGDGVGAGEAGVAAAGGGVGVAGAADGGGGAGAL